MDDVLEHTALDDRDESVRIAVCALGDMRNSIQGSPSASFQTTPALTIASRSSSPSLLEEDSPDFVSRMSHYPIVNTALRAYEQGKASSRVVKYGAEMMESSVKTISRPVIDRLPVTSIDEFACRQLDKLDRLGSYSRRRSTSEAPHERERDRACEREESSVPHSERSRGWTSALRDMSSPRGRTYETSSPVDSYRDRDVSMSRGDDETSDRSAERRNRTPTPRQNDLSTSSENQQQVAQRSRWQAMLLEAGGIGAAVSEESMRRLKYCLQWLQYATNQIDQQILKLREFITSMQDPSSSSSPHSVSATVIEEQLQVLTSIRREVVDTIRQVVDVVSKYAGGALPEPARARVRTFILCLPQRWQQAAERSIAVAGVHGVSGASTNAPDTTEVGRGRGRATASAPYSYGPGEAGPSQRSRPASRASSPSSLRSHGRGFVRQANGVVPPTAGAATHAAQKILTLATESLDMLRAVTAVFKESLDKADAWVERLRIVGLQRQNSAMTPPPTLPPPSALESYRDPLPPILTPGSSRAHSPESAFTQLTLPPLDPSLYAPHNHNYHRVHHHHAHNRMHGYPPIFTGEGTQNRAGDAARDFDALSLGARSGYATPRSATVNISPEVDGGAGWDVPEGVRTNARDESASSTKMEVDP